MPNTTAIPSRCAPLSKLTLRLPAAARSVATALALCLLALPNADWAKAQDIAPTSSSRSALVFSPVIFSTDQSDSAELCAWNRSSATAQVTFVFENTETATLLQPTHTVTIAPRHSQCAFITGVTASVGASIVLNSPSLCSQVTKYPGRCGVIAAFELFEGGEPRQRVHLEPVLQPASVHVPLLTLPQ